MANGGEDPRRETADGGEGRQRNLTEHNGTPRDVPPTLPQLTPGATFSLAEAAERSGIPIRTLRDWAKVGRLETLEPLPGQRGARVTAAVVETLRQIKAADGGEIRQEAAAGNGEEQQPAAAEGERRQETAAADDPVKLRRAVENATGRLAELHDQERRLRAELEAEREKRAALEAQAAAAEQIRSERDRLINQLDESRQAERELRVLMLRQAEQIQALTAGHEPRALPEKTAPTAAEPSSGPDPQPAPARPWWKLWGK